jgi:RNA polymerase sigma-70 factor (ECF subfamily)
MTFLKAFQHVAEFREDAKFSTWLIRIAMNQSLMVLRKRRTSKVFNESSLTSEEEHIPMEAVDWAPNPEQLYGTSELREILRKTLATLSPGLRAVFILRDIEGFSLQETAEALGLSLSAVKARSLRARLRLRNRLSRYFKQASEMPQVEPDAGNRAGEEFY